MQGKLRTHEATLREHFKEEEDMVPLLRSTFTFKEYQAVRRPTLHRHVVLPLWYTHVLDPAHRQQTVLWLAQTTMKMVKQMGPYELPSMLAFMPDEERRAFMKRVRT